MSDVLASTSAWNQANWAQAVLQDAGLPQTQGNITNIMRWMDAEEPDTDWWDRNNPLNASLGTSAADGTGAYPNLATSASYTARMLQQSNMSGIYNALAGNAPVSTFSSAVVASPWASSHYGGDPGHIASIPIPPLIPATTAAGTSSITTSTGGAGQGVALGGSITGLPSDSMPQNPGIGDDPIAALGSQVQWLGEWLGWALFILIIFLFGAVLFLLGAAVLISIFAGPAVGPVAAAIGTKSPVGKAASLAAGAASSRSANRAAAEAGPQTPEDINYDPGARDARALGRDIRGTHTRTSNRGGPRETRSGGGNSTPRVTIPRTTTQKKRVVIAGERDF